MTDSELIKQWNDGEKHQGQLWKQILERGLYLNALGIDPDKRDSAWRNPPSITRDTEKRFYHGVAGGPRRAYNRREVRAMLTQAELAEFE